MAWSETETFAADDDYRRSKIKWLSYDKDNAWIYK